jgi:hypothetical protein
MVHISFTDRPPLVQWYAGINIGCKVYDNFENFTMRVWEGECTGEGPACNPSTGSVFPPTTKCHDDIYNNGNITGSENCERQIGRGTALVVSGCCQFYDSQEGCSSTSYLKLAEGACQDPIQIDNFTCVGFKGQGKLPLGMQFTNSL